MKYKSFTQYVTEATKEVTFTFGRFNPPTIGHEKLLNAVNKTARGSKYIVFASQTNDNKKNPLEYASKIKTMRKMFPRHARSIVLDKSIRNIFDILTKLYSEGHNKVTMVVGSDRVTEFETLTNTYNNKKGKHGFYNFEGGVNIVSAGERDPDADGASGMSASKMRAAAKANDLSSFSKGLPSGYKDAKKIFNDVRNGMGLKESHNFTEHLLLQPVSEEREAYVEGDLFAEGDVVVIKESEEIGQVIMLGSNYVLVEMADGKKLRKWLDSVEKIEEKMQEPYHKGLAKSTADKRDAQFKKQAKMDDDNPNAYKLAPGDKTAKTKTSKHTKKYAKMYGEKIQSFSSFNEIISEDENTGLKKKAEKSGMPLSILRQVYNRGVAAWKSGHRPGTNPQQWGYARVNSFVTKSSGTWGKADKDLAAKVRS